MLFRFHRGGLKESMETVIEVNSMNELIDAIGFPHEITFQHIGMDTRVNWDTYYVIADDKVIGMSNSKVFNPPI